MPQQTYVIPASVINIAASVPANSSVQSALIPTGSASAGGWQAGAVGCVLAAAGTLKVQRYLDAAGLLPLGTAVTATLVNGVGNTVGWADNLPYQSIQITVTNSSGSAAALSSMTAVLQCV